MRPIFQGFQISIILIVAIFGSRALLGQEKMVREGYLQQLLKVLPSDLYTSPADYKPGTSNPRVTPEDFTWRDWQKRTGELPPDFDKLPFHPFLPNPLILDEGGKNIPVRTIKQWNEKREEIKKTCPVLDYWHDPSST